MARRVSDTAGARCAAALLLREGEAGKRRGTFVVRYEVRDAGDGVDPFTWTSWTADGSERRAHLFVPRSFVPLLNGLVPTDSFLVLLEVRWGVASTRSRREWYMPKNGSQMREGYKEDEVTE